MKMRTDNRSDILSIWIFWMPVKSETTGAYRNIIVIVFFGVPLISAYLSVILLPFIVINIRTIMRKGLAGREVQESLSMSTMVFDHLITIIYAVSFVVAGLGLIEVRIDYLIMLAAAFVIVFGLEGLGIACSRVVLQEQ